MPRDRTAGLVVVGNEILSGKVVDTNAPFLARELRALGVELRRIVTIPDDLEEIAAAVREFAARYDVVFTSGGVGPTHDDVTIAGVARGLGRAVVRHPVIESRIREFYGEKVNAARLKMAEVPEGTELIVDGRLGFPTIKCENVYVLPGIPELFEQKFLALRDRFAAAPSHPRGRGRDRRALERHARGLPGPALGLVSEARRPGVRGEAHPRIERPRVRRARARAPARAPAARGGRPDRVAPGGAMR